MFVGTVIYLKINKTKLERMYYYFIKNQLSCLYCIKDINENFPRRLLEHPVKSYTKAIKWRKKNNIN